MPTDFFSPSARVSAIPARFMTVGAIATAVVAGWSSTAFAATASPAGQGTAARAAACNTSDAVVIGSGALNPLIGSSGSPGTVQTKYSRSCNTGWAYLHLGGALPSGATAGATYNSPVFQQQCTVSTGSTGCSTFPLTPNCGAGIASGSGFKFAPSGGWESGTVEGVLC
ncbi:DUF2690 domain-containing protein [Frankia sp. AgB1.9]|nr:DUF2690 domain-containing protein [Frankia sp. AgW1.1]MBL7547513.1 DUF2690 domain-containing protein [Frankia sp. AgB1.9]MBL7619024.1 DUF2690 domain-containing protein [Frankia sp. AgB1.8]